jgi:hypothetical protein
MRIICLIILTLMVACQNNARPKEVLTQAQLSALLVEVYLAEAKLDAIPKPKDTTIKYFLPFEEKLLKRFNVSDSVLRKTYSYYLEHPKELEEIYDSVIDTLTLREQRSHLIPAPPKALAQ